MSNELWSEAELAHAARLVEQNEARREQIQRVRQRADEGARMATRQTAKAATKAQAKRPASPPAAKGNPDALKIADPRYVDPVKRGAMIAANPVVRGAVASRKYSEWIFGKDASMRIRPIKETHQNGGN